MANNRRRHAERPVTDPLIELYEIQMPARFGGGIQRWTPGPLMSFGNNLLNMNCWWGATLAGWHGANTAPNQIGAAATYLGTNSLDDSGLFRLTTTLGVGAIMSIRSEATRIIAAPGAWFEFQSMLIGSNCNLQLAIIWRDAGGTLISTSLGPVVAGNYPSTFSAPKDFVFASMQAQAPANSAFAQVELRGIGQGIAGALVVAYRPMLARIDGPSDTPLSYQKPSALLGNVSFGGLVYTPVPVNISGWEVASNGPIPRPRVVIPNIDGFARALMGAYGDLLGAKLSRKRTFLYALDGMERPDSTDFYGPDVWYFDRVVLAAPEMIEFELCSPLDLQGKMLPNGQIIRDVCTHSYRTWNASTSSFVQGTCPYAGGGMWDASGTATAIPAQDDCGRRIRDCDLRFPGQDLPTKAFPGVAVARR